MDPVPNIVWLATQLGTLGPRSRDGSCLGFIREQERCEVLLGPQSAERIRTELLPFLASGVHLGREMLEVSPDPEQLQSG